MIFKDVIKHILSVRRIDCKELAFELDISDVQVQNLLTGVTKKPNDRIYNKIMHYCKVYSIDVDLDWNEILYDIFFYSDWYREYLWLSDMNEEGYVLLKHKVCGKKTLVPFRDFGTCSTPCIHCWVDKYVSRDAYYVDLSESDHNHVFRHKCGHYYTVTYDEIKQKKFRCPVCPGYKYSIENIKKYKGYCDSDFIPEEKVFKGVFENLTNDEWWDFLGNIGKYIKGTEHSNKQGEFMEIKIMSRKDIEKHCSLPLKEKTAVISICDAYSSFASLLFKPDHLLQLSFNDVDSDIFVDILGENYSPKETGWVEEDFNMFSNEQAKLVVDFINKIWGKVDVLICQCEHGQSRSAAIAAAIAEFKSKRGIDIFADERYYPNKFVYWRVLNKLNEFK